MEQNIQVTGEEKIWGLIGYLWVLCLIPLLMKRESKFVLFHAKQGLMLFLSSIILGALTMLPIIGFIAVCGNVLVFALSIFGIFNALSGKYWKIPFIGKYPEKLEL